MQIEVIGSSMEPTIPQGTKVQVRECVPALGLVVAIQSGETIIVHRLVDTFRHQGKQYFLHRGDATKQVGLCADHEVMGEVEGMEKCKLGWFARLRVRARWLLGLRAQRARQSP